MIIYGIVTGKSGLWDTFTGKMIPFKDIYVMHNKCRWKADRIGELQKDGMIFVIYRCQKCKHVFTPDTINNTISSCAYKDSFRPNGKFFNRVKKEMRRKKIGKIFCRMIGHSKKTRRDHQESVYCCRCGSWLRNESDKKPEDFQFFIAPIGKNEEEQK